MQYFELGSPGGLPFSPLSLKASDQNWLIPVASDIFEGVKRPKSRESGRYMGYFSDLKPIIG